MADNSNISKFDVKLQALILRNPHQCPLCQLYYHRKNALIEHIDLCSSVNDYKNREEIYTKNIIALEEEAKSMASKGLCYCCAETLNLQHKGIIPCNLCKKCFYTRAGFERHVFTSHFTDDTFLCEICGDHLRSKVFFKLHLDQHKILGTAHVCEYCKQQFVRVNHFQRHITYSQCAIRHGHFKCIKCQTSFTDLNSLKLHKKEHTDNQAKQTKFVCRYCERTCPNKFTLKIHERIHTKELPFVCDTCSKSFKSLREVKVHRRYHTGEKPYECPSCLKCFTTKEVLNRHKKVHTNDRKYVCNMCEKSFIQHVHLKLHAKQHDGPHKCQICSATFKFYTTLIHLVLHFITGRSVI
ncbi:protein suppressor of hairy wing-like isoform X1 [Teleopsis dalmanni]|uniref:protein suppressor of hairy wing-like isoform X1 n=1 Tax=Teleopsis dalmanni TaxID=139649 RepID=UPI0018CE9A22|nr:protein suppressor of hairy wing-like isoform X1 [Teleopsis dalmanni]